MTETKSVNSNTKELLPNAAFNDGCELDTAENMKIVCVTACARVTGTEALSDELRIEVKTTFTTVYQGENGFEVVKKSVENTRSIAKDGLKPSSKAFVTAQVTDCTHSDRSAVATVEIGGWYVSENALDYLSSELDGIHCRTENVRIESLAVLKQSSLTLTRSNETRLPVGTILDCTEVAVVNNAYPSAGVLQIEGELITRIAAVTDNGQFFTQSFTQPFGTEIAEELCRADSIADADVTVTRDELTLTEKGGKMLISDTELTISYWLTETVEIVGVTDCYSTEEELSITSSVCSLNGCFCERAVHDKSATTVKTDGVITELGCAVCPAVSAVNITADGAVKAEGLITATVIYSDENNLCTALPVAIPFITELSKDYDCSEILDATAKVLNLSARLRTAAEIEVTAEYTVTVRGTTNKEVTLVSAIEKGEKKEEDDCAICLYIVKHGETLWDVAKELNTDEDTLLRLNKELTLPLKDGDKVLLYKELTYKED